MLVVLNHTLQVLLALITCDGRPLMIPGPSDKIDFECSHDRRDYEEDDDLLFNELLFGAGGAQEPHRAKPKHDHGTRRSNEAIGHPLQNDCNHTSIPGPKQCDAKGGDIDSSGRSLHLSRDGPTCKAQGERPCSFSTPSTFVEGSEARCDPRYRCLLILVLTDGAYLDVPFFARRSKILSPILLFHSLIPSSRRYATMPTKILSLTTHLAKGKTSRGTREVGTQKMSGRLKDLDL